MPKLTTTEDELLKRLTAKNVLTLGKAAMQEAANLIYRLMNVADEATKDKQANGVLLQEARFENSAICVAALGMVPRESIEKKEALSPAMRERCLELRQNYDDALAYRTLMSTPEVSTPDEAAQ